MRTALLAILLLLGLRSPAQTVEGVMVETNGAFAVVYLQGMSTGGVYTPNLGAWNRMTGNEGFLLTLSSLGYDTTCELTRRMRMMCGTTVVRRPHPDTAQLAETVLGSGRISLRIALSDFVYSGDTGLVARIAGGWYANGSTNVVAASVIATNASTLTYPRFAANWQWVPHTQITNAAYELRATTIAPYPMEAHPLAVMQFIAESGSTRITNNATLMTVDWGMPDQTPVVEYIAQMDATGFSDGALVTNRFRACPWIGDTNSVLDTATMPWANPTTLPAPFILLANRGGTFQAAVARVNPVTGSDGTGRAYQPPFNSLTHTQAFLTLAKAASASSASNGVWYARTNVEGSTTYTDAGKLSWTGGTATVGNSTRTFYTIESLVGTNSYIETSSGSQNLGGMVRLVGLGIINTNTALAFEGLDRLWLDRCHVDTPWTNHAAGSGQATFGSTIRALALTHCRVRNIKQGITPWATTGNMTTFLRGNLFTDYDDTILVYNATGNLATNTPHLHKGPSLTHTRHAFNQTMPFPHSLLVMCNRWYGLRTVGTAFMQDSMVWTNQWAVGWAQNLHENCTNGSPVMWWSADGCVTPDSDTTLAYNNFIGQRTNLRYQDSGTNFVSKTKAFVYGNIIEDFNVKESVFPPGSGNRTGNWSFYYGCGFSMNWFPEVTSVGAAGSFVPAFAGLFADAVAEGVTRSTNYIPFVRRAAWDGVAASAGNGDYRLRSDAVQMDPTSYAPIGLPYDIDGKPRGRRSPPGAYASGPDQGFLILVE